MVKTEIKLKKSYIVLALCVLACVVGVLGYRYYRSRQEKNAEAKLSELKAKESSAGINDADRRSLATSYYNLYKNYPKTKAGRTACYSAGMMYYNLKDYDKTIEMLQYCPPFEGTTAMFAPEKQKMLGEAYHHKKNYKKAIECYTKATEKDFGYQAQYWDELADCHKAAYDENKDVKHLEEAIKALKKACDLHPDYEKVDTLLKKQAQFEMLRPSSSK